MMEFIASEEVRILSSIHDISHRLIAWDEPLAVLSVSLEEISYFSTILDSNGFLSSSPLYIY